MKKFLLMMMLCVTTVVGAWADEVTFTNPPSAIEVGEEVFIPMTKSQSTWGNTDNPLSWQISVTDPEVLDAVDYNTWPHQNTLKVTGKAVGTTTIYVKLVYTNKEDSDPDKVIYSKSLTMTVNAAIPVVDGFSIGDVTIFANESVDIPYTTPSWTTSTDGATYEYEAVPENSSYATASFDSEGVLTVTGGNEVNSGTNITVKISKLNDGVVTEKATATFYASVVAKPTFNGFNINSGVALKSSIEFAEYYQPAATCSWTNAEYPWTQSVDVVSSSNVKAFFENGYLHIYGLEAGAATITLTPKATSGGTIITGEAKIINITVNPLTKELTLTPDGNLDVALNASAPAKVATAIWKNSSDEVLNDNALTNADPTGQYSIATSNGSVTATIDKSGNITVTPVSVGETEVTVTATYKKSFNYYGNFDAVDTKTATFSVNVFDPTVASSFSIYPESPITVDKGSTTDVEVRIEPAEATYEISEATGVTVSNVEYAGKKYVRIDATAAEIGTATFKLTPNGLAPVVVTVDVVAPRVPVTASCPEVVRFGQNNLSASAVLGVEEADKENYTVSFSSKNPEFLTVDSETGALSPLALGNAIITVTATPKSSDAEYAEFTQDFPVSVAKGQYTFSANADPAFFVVEEDGTSTLSYTNVQLNGVDATTGFEVTYSPKTSKAGVSLDGNTVTIASSATAGTFTAVATLTPANTDNYEVATAEVDITIGTPGLAFSLSDQTMAKNSVPYIESFVSVVDEAFNADGTSFTPSAESTDPSVVIAEWGGINKSFSALTFRPKKAGEADITLTVQAKTPSGKTTSAKTTIHVTVTASPLTFTVGSITVNDDQTLTADVIKSAVEVKGKDQYGNNVTITSGYDVEVKYNGETVTSVPAQGSGVNTFDIDVYVKATDTENYADAVAPETVSVTVTHLKSFDLALNADKTSIMDNGQTATITPAATYTEDEVTTDVAISSYDMTYNLSDAGVATVNKDGNTITVTGQKAGTVTVIVTAHPEDGSTYATVTNSTTITVTESQKVYLTTETIDGKDYVVVNVPEGGAFGGISDTPKIDETNSTVDIAALKAAANVKVKGSISNSDVQELVCLIGGVSGAVGNCKILDMGDATMTEAITQTGDKCSLVGGVDAGGTQSQKTMLNAEKIVLPKPASGYTVLPQNTNALFSAWFTNSGNEVTELVIPEGWTELAYGCFGKTEAVTSGQALDHLTSLTLPASIETLGSYVFASCTSLKSVDMSACDKLTVIPESAFEDCRKGPGDGLRDIKFPPNLEYIYDNAFRHHEANVLMFPPKLREIHEGAFENYGGANSLTDVFFTGVTVTPNFVATTAFSASTQMCNNSVADNALLPDGSMAISNGTITRNSYHNGGFLGCILHFPAEADRWKYTDPYRVYSDGGRSEYTGGNEGEWNSKSMFGYNPTDWTPEFAATMTAKATYIKENEESQAGFLYGTSTVRWDKSGQYGDQYDVYIDGGYPDRTFGSNKLWPSQQQMQNGYTISRAGYLWNGTPMTTRELDPDNNVDLRGLYQFIVAFTDAPDSPERWNFGDKYQKDKWYTFCVPFNMSVEEIKNVFGDGTKVCRFSGVTRTVSTDATPNKIVLEFRKSVMEAGGYSSADQIKVSTVLGSDGKAVDTYADATTTGIVHHVPYMIKPGGDAGEKDPDFKENGNRVLPNFKRVGGVMVFDVIKNSGYSYSYEGIFEPIPLPNHVYFLAKDPNSATGEHRFFFSHNATGKLSAYTASVRVRKENAAEDRGDDDWTAFFNSKTVINANSPAKQSKVMFSYFGDDSATTDIEEVEIVCGEDSIESSDNVYTLGGQQVNMNSLPAGVYIKNGKKFVVK